VLACTLAVAVLLPASLVICACRTDAIRYQSEAPLPVFLLLGGVPSMRGKSALWAIPIAMLLAAALPGLTDIARPDVHAQAYAIARAAPQIRSLVIAAPMANRRVLTQFPDYAAGTTLASGLGGRCTTWIGVSCWSFTAAEVAGGVRAVEIDPGAPMRRECVDLVHGDLAAVRALQPIDVPHRDRELHRVLAEHPRVGFVDHCN
jgi:hypothetical protein